MTQSWLNNLTMIINHLSYLLSSDRQRIQIQNPRHGFATWGHCQRSWISHIVICESWKQSRQRHRRHSYFWPWSLYCLELIHNQGKTRLYIILEIKKLIIYLSIIQSPLSLTFISYKYPTMTNPSEYLRAFSKDP